MTDVIILMIESFLSYLITFLVTLAVGIIFDKLVHEYTIHKHYRDYNQYNKLYGNYSIPYWRYRKIMYNQITYYRIGLIIAILGVIGVCFESCFGSTSMPSRDFAQNSAVFSVIGIILIVLYIVSAILALFIVYFLSHHKDYFIKQSRPPFTHHSNNNY